jgi:hypothetical protein
MCVNRAADHALLLTEDVRLPRRVVMRRTYNWAPTRLRSLFAVALAALTLVGCGGSGGNDSAPVADTGSACSGNNCGTLLVGLTDADGDFVSYSVDVLSVTLRRLNGASVETLPAATRIDFAQLTELADLLAVTTLAPGDMVGGTIRLDYSNAEVFVEVGGQVVAATVVDENGAALGVTELKINLSDRNHLVITRGRATFLALDFDLATSHEVDVTRSPPVVTARPYIVADVEPVNDKELRLRGALVTTDVAASTYTIDVRPWFRPDGNHGRVTIHTTSTTTFEIDGVTATGTPGLTALAQKPAGTLTVAFGSLAVQDRKFTAEIVHAGDSVGGERIDAVHGNVVSRNGNQLTVKGAYAVRRNHPARLHRTVLVDVGPDTAVLKTGAPGETLDASAISVGQHIVAFGSFSEAASTSAPAVLDATAGRIRLLPTHLRGTVNSIVAGQLNLELRAIDRLGIDMFDFRGTGVTADVDADPSDYEVTTGTMALSTLAAGEAAKVLGFVAPFGAAPPDFEGRTVIDHRDLPALLGIGWGASGTTAPFLSMGNAGLVLDLGNANIGERHALMVGMRRVDLLDLPAAPTIVPAAGRVLFGVSADGDIELFTSFADFSAEITTRLATGKAAVALTASGSYDEGANSLAANYIAMHFAAN